MKSKTFDVFIVSRYGLRWHIRALAQSSVQVVKGLAPHFPADARITVVALRIAA